MLPKKNTFSSNELLSMKFFLGVLQDRSILQNTYKTYKGAYMEFAFFIIEGLTGEPKSGPFDLNLNDL